MSVKRVTRYVPWKTLHFKASSQDTTLSESKGQSFQIRDAWKPYRDEGDAGKEERRLSDRK